MTDPAVPHANGRAWINFDLPSSGRYCQLTDGVQPTERPAAIGQKRPFTKGCSRPKNAVQLDAKALMNYPPTVLG